MTDYFTCKKFHDDCLSVNLNKLKTVIKYTLKVYSIVHGAPLLLFSRNRKELITNPKQTLLKFISKVLSSMGFLGTFIMWMRFTLCQFRHKSKMDVLNIITWCLCCTLGVLLETPKRAEDYSVFTIPRVLEGIWDCLKKFGYVKDTPHSMNVIFAASMALLLVIKVHYTEEMPGNYKNQVGFFFGKEENEKVIKADKEKSESTDTTA